MNDADACMALLQSPPPGVAQAEVVKLLVRKRQGREIVRRGVVEGVVPPNLQVCVCVGGDVT